MITETGVPAELDQDAAWRAHAPALVRYATLLVGPTDAGDVVSVAFLRVMRATRDVRDLRSYLMRAVTNAALDQHRSRQRRQVRDLRVAATAPVAGRDGATAGADLDVRRAVAALSVRQRAVVYFTYWEDLDSNQVAALLGITPASVRRHLMRARAHLRKVLS